MSHQPPNSLADRAPGPAPGRGCGGWQGCSRAIQASKDRESSDGEGVRGEKRDKGEERRAQKDKRKRGKRKKNVMARTVGQGTGRCYPMDLEFQFCKMKRFWRADAQRESP